MRMMRRSRSGYVFLISVLVIGVIAVDMILSLTLLGIAAEHSGLTVQRAAQADEYAQSCAEQALLALRADPTYDGGTQVSFDDGTCSILHTGGSGTADRALCIEGRSGKTVRRLEIGIARLFPSVAISSWKQVRSFTLCP